MDISMCLRIAKGIVAFSTCQIPVNECALSSAISEGISVKKRMRASKLSPFSSPKQTSKSEHSEQEGAVQRRNPSSLQIMRKKNFFHFMS